MYIEDLLGVAHMSSTVDAGKAGGADPPALTGTPPALHSAETGYVAPSCSALMPGVLSSPHCGGQLWSSEGKPLKLDGADDP